MRIRIRARTEWAQVGGRRVPYPLSLGLPAGVRMRDVTAQAATAIAPGLPVVVDLVGEAAVLDAIDDDPHVVELWREEL